MAGRRGQQDPADDTSTADPAPPAEADSSNADRLAKVEAEQQRQGGLLQQILDKLPGGPPKDGAAAGGPPAPGPAAPSEAPDLRGMVRAEIDAAEQRRADEKWAEDDDKWRKGVDKFMEAVKSETAPRDPAPGVRGILQRFTVGRPD